MVTAPQTHFRDEFIASFEFFQSILRDTVTTEAIIKGNVATFLVSGSGGASATTRGANGQIPARQNDNNQISVTLEEVHDLVEHTKFDIQSSQGDQRLIMQKSSMAVLNRSMESVIIDALTAGTLGNGASEVVSTTSIGKAKRTLYQHDVPVDSDLFGLVTPGFYEQLEDLETFASSDYINTKPHVSQNGSPGGQQKMRFWRGVNWFTSTQLPGMGTTSAQCFIYHRNAIGHAVHKGGIDLAMGYDEKQACHFVRSSVDHGAKILQNTGIYKFSHNDTA